MIRGIHGMIYSADADASRAFLRDQLKLPYSDVGDGWLIFDLPEGDVGFHPADDSTQGMVGRHDVSFYCDDIHGTVAELRSRGVEFKSEVADHGYGFVTYFTIPGGIEVQLYEPKYRKRARPAAKPKLKAARGARKPKPKPKAKAKAKAKPGKARKGRK